jgi:pyrroline-5-carboxylate reductase
VTDLPRAVLLAGAGKMGGALLRGWLDAGLAPEHVDVFDPHPSEELTALVQQRGVRLNRDLGAIATPEVFVLAVKPQMLAAAAPAFGQLRLDDAVLVSIVAGKTVADLAAHIKVAAIVRAMPNTPAAVGRGITGAFAAPGVSDAQRQATQALLACVGQVEWVAREALIDAVTAVSGSGPAYVFFMVECLAEAARSVGLDPGQAERFARATVEGAGALLVAEQGTSAEQLRRNVTSPGGTTAAALEVLQSAGGLQALMVAAVAAARDRAVALAG